MIFTTETPYIHHLNRVTYSSQNQNSWRSLTSHLHKGNELIFYLGGHDVTASENEEISNTGNSIKFIPAAAFSKKLRVKSLESGTHILVSFYADGSTTDKIISVDATDRPNIKRLFLKLNEIWIHKKPGYYTRAMSVLYEIVHEIDILDHETYLPQKLYGKIEPAVLYIHDHYFENHFPYKSLPDICGISPAYFNRLFNKKFNCSPVKYVTKLRMKQAIDYITSKCFTMEEIAHKVGYESAYYFSRVFKENYGCAPSRYDAITHSGKK